MDKSTHNTRIELVIADLAKQDAPNYMGIAKKYGLNYTTLRRWFLGEQLSKEAAASQYWQCLTAI